MPVAPISKRRLQLFLNGLSLSNTKVARVAFACELCACAIQIGQEYRGAAKKAHEFCFKACARKRKDGGVM